MYRFRGLRAAPLVGMLLLSACAADDSALIAPFGRVAGAPPAESLTARRVMGQEVAFEALTYEPGTVWPDPADQRWRIDPAGANAPLPFNPAVPYQPSPTLPPRAASPTPPPRIGSSSPPPPPLPALPPIATPMVPNQPVSPPAPRADGRVIPIPGSAPAITTGGTPGAPQTFTTPGGGAAGLAVQEGATTTLIGPDGRVRIVPSPR